MLLLLFCMDSICLCRANRILSSSFFWRASSAVADVVARSQASLRPFLMSGAKNSKMRVTMARKKIRVKKPRTVRVAIQASRIVHRYQQWRLLHSYLCIIKTCNHRCWRGCCAIVGFLPAVALLFTRSLRLKEPPIIFFSALRIEQHVSRPQERGTLRAPHRHPLLGLYPGAMQQLAAERALDFCIRCSLGDT